MWLWPPGVFSLLDWRRRVVCWPGQHEHLDSLVCQSPFSFARIQYLLLVRVIVEVNKNGQGPLPAGRPHGKCVMCLVYKHRGAVTVAGEGTWSSCLLWLPLQYRPVVNFVSCFCFLDLDIWPASSYIPYWLIVVTLSIVSFSAAPISLCSLAVCAERSRANSPACSLAVCAEWSRANSPACQILSLLTFRTD